MPVMQPVPGRLTALAGLLLLCAAASAGRAHQDSWSQSGNAATDPAADYLGTTDNEDLVIRTSALERMRVTSRGRVGIGTDDPGARLHVVTPGSQGPLLLVEDDSGLLDLPLFLYLGPEGRMALGGDEPTARLDVLAGAGEDGLVVRHGGYEPPDLVVAADGNVGINAADPGARLVVHNDFFGQRPLMSVAAGEHPAFHMSSAGSVTIDPVGAGVALRVRASSTTANSDTTPVPFYVTAAGDANAIYVTREGEVGIGTAGEGITDRLRVRGPDNDGSRATIRVVSGPNQQTMLIDGNEIDGISAGLFLNHNTDENVVLATGGGNVGIGTSSPNHELVVEGNDPAVQIRDDTTDNSANAARLELLERAGGDFDGGAFLRWNGDTDRLLIGTKQDGQNSNVLVVDRSTQSVGIGTQSTGNSRLAVRHPNHQLRIVDSDNNKTWTLTTHQASGGLGFWEDASDGRFLVTAGGRVGIGTTSPDHELVVQGDDPALQIRDDTTDNSANAARLELLESAGGSFNGGAFLWWNGDSNRLLIGTKEGGANTNVLVVDRATSSVGIGTQSPGDFRLAVNGAIRAKEVVVETGWSDFVFAPGYELARLEEVERHIAEHGHLPDVPSATQVAREGVRLGEMDSTLLRKIEELTLYVIGLHRRVGDLEEENARLRGEAPQRRSEPRP